MMNGLIKVLNHLLAEYRDRIDSLREESFPKSKYYEGYFVANEPFGSDQHLILSDEFFENGFDQLFDKLVQADYEKLAEILTTYERKELIYFCSNFVRVNLIETIELEDDVYLEVLSLSQVIRPYRHPNFCNWLSFIGSTVHLLCDLDNHNFGYHFHLLQKGDRTKTLLTYNPTENPNSKLDATYASAGHTLYQESHGPYRPFINLNTSGKNFRKSVKAECEKTLQTKIEKKTFLRPGKNATVVQ